MCGARLGRRVHAYPTASRRLSMSSRSTRRRIARYLAGAFAIFSVATPVATASPIAADLHLRGHGAAQTIRTQPTARSFVLADRATPQAAPSTSHVLADRVPGHGPVVVASSPPVSDDGFDWGSAGIGGGIAVLALGLGAGLAAGSRRHPGSPPPPPSQTPPPPRPPPA